MHVGSRAKVRENIAYDCTLQRNIKYIPYTVLLKVIKVQQSLFEAAHILAPHLLLADHCHSAVHCCTVVHSRSRSRSHFQHNFYYYTVVVHIRYCFPDYDTAACF
ncbi:hypothetical protein Hanom_Chr08g00752951 [Helianthus anomalus]